MRAVFTCCLLNLKRVFASERVLCNNPKSSGKIPSASREPVRPCDNASFPPRSITAASASGSRAARLCGSLTSKGGNKPPSGPKWPPLTFFRLERQTDFLARLPTRRGGDEAPPLTPNNKMNRAKACRRVDSCAKIFFFT